MKERETRTAHVSDIFQTECDPRSGKGLMGFVITYPDGRIENRVLSYDSETHDENYFRISEIRKGVLSAIGIRLR